MDNRKKQWQVYSLKLQHIRNKKKINKNLYDCKILTKKDKKQKFQQFITYFVLSFLCNTKRNGNVYKIRNKYSAIPIV